jgi:hypothetical protein
MIIQGDKGSAKSTLAQMCKDLTDKGKGAKRSLSLSEEDIFIAAKNNFVLSFDNLSGLSNKFSDVFCRISTGAAFSKRKKYSDDEEYLIELMRPVILNGIDHIAERGDLADRAIITHLPKIPEAERKTIQEVQKEFDKDHPILFALLLNGLVGILNEIDKVKLPHAPRMADFAKWGTAAEKAMGWEEGSFLKALEDNQKDSKLEALSVNPVANALIRFLSASKEEKWTGNMSSLLEEFKMMFSHKSRYFPSTESALSKQIGRIQNELEEIGIKVNKLGRTSGIRPYEFIKLPSFVPLEDKEDEENDEDFMRVFE